VLDEYLRRHDGVITLAQARSAGLTKQAVSRRVVNGKWVRCARRVYFADDRAFTDAARIRSAVWGYGDHAVGSGVTAAWWLGLTRFAPEIVEVTVPRDSNGRCHDGSVVRRRDLHPADVVERDGLRVTAPALTIVEAAVRRGDGARLMDSALQRDAELRDLWRAHLRNKGRYGSPAARRLLQAAADGARSQAERLLVKLLRDARITGWQANYGVGGYKIDVAFAAQRVAIEVDGWAYHSAPVDFQIDRERQNNIALLGWQVLRFTWLDLTEHPQRVLSVIRTAISAC
jgi:very-short-patch-repair endonuclease